MDVCFCSDKKENREQEDEIFKMSGQEGSEKVEGANYCCLYLSRCFLIIVAGVSIFYNGYHLIAFYQPPCGVHPSESSGSNWPRPQYIPRTPPYFAPRSSAHRMNYRNKNLRQIFFWQRRHNVFEKHRKNLCTLCVISFTDTENLRT